MTENQKNPPFSSLSPRTCFYVAGHQGMVGSALVRSLKAQGYANIATRTHAELDLTDQQSVRNFFQSQKVDYVVLAAAKVGGIYANNTFPAEFIYQNLMIAANVIHESCRSGVQRLLFLGSSCIYPRLAPQPMKEEYLLSGKLEPTNEPYAVAKIAGIKLCESFNRQYATRYSSVMPTNLYGPNDNFDLENSHVLSALIRKFHLAKLAARGDWEGIRKDESRFGAIPEEFVGCLAAISRLKGHPSLLTNDGMQPAEVKLWGSGNPRREFLHVDDLADACVFVMSRGDGVFEALFDESASALLNIGCGEDLTIRDLAEKVAKIVGYQGDVFWDRSKPDGIPRKLLDVSKLRDLGWKPSISLEKGIEQAYAWYLQQ